MTIEAYKIVSEENRETLESSVSALIIMGWIPQGGVTVVPEAWTSRWWYFQAMVKMADNP